MIRWASIVKWILPYKKAKDYCSFWPDWNWGDCCRQHDDDYKYGEIPRPESDAYLRECVSCSGYPKMSKLMHFGVRKLGWIAWNNHRRRNLKRSES